MVIITALLSDLPISVGSFIKDKQRDLVIDSIRKGRPLNVMYWSEIGNNIYEVLDGQQRTISVAQYVNKDFPIKVNGNDKFFQNLSDTECDHTIPWSQGGRTIDSNLQMLCQKCNNDKSSQ